MKERCDREWPQRSFWCSLGEIWGWDHNSKQLNSQQRGQHRSLFRRKTGCHGWGCKQSRPLPRAVRAAKLCPHCSPSPGRELQIRRKKAIATIVATTKSNVQKGRISGLVQKKNWNLFSDNSGDGEYLRLFLPCKKSASIAFWYRNAACRENPDPNAACVRRVDG